MMYVYVRVCGVEWAVDFCRIGFVLLFIFTKQFTLNTRDRHSTNIFKHSMFGRVFGLTKSHDVPNIIIFVRIACQTMSDPVCLSTIANPTNIDEFNVRLVIFSFVISLAALIISCVSGYVCMRSLRFTCFTFRCVRFPNEWTIHMRYTKTWCSVTFLWCSYEQYLLIASMRVLKFLYNWLCLQYFGWKKWDFENLGRGSRLFFSYWCYWPAFDGWYIFSAHKFHFNKFKSEFTFDVIWLKCFLTKM